MVDILKTSLNPSLRQFYNIEMGFEGSLNYLGMLA